MHFGVSVAQTSKLVGENVSWQKGSFNLSFNPVQLIWAPMSDAMALATGGSLVESVARRVEIRFTDEAGEQCLVAIKRGRNRNISVSLSGRVLGERLQDMSVPFSVYTPGLAGIAREERYLSPGVVRRSVARGDANLVLRNVLYMLSQEPVKWGVFIDDMNELFNDVQISVSFDQNADEHITTRISIDGGPLLPLDAAGTAVLQAAQILGYSALYNPPLVLLDEPDSHLHPNNQRELCRLLEELSVSRGFRLVVSTHSRHVLDAFRGNSNTIWMNHGERVVTGQEDLSARLLELGALDSIDYFANDELKCVVLTEDTDDRPLRALLWSSGFDEADTKVCSYAGCSSVAAATVLGQFVNQQATNVAVVVHRDRDFMTDDEVEAYCERITNCGLVPFVTAGNDVESHYLNVPHVASHSGEVGDDVVQQLLEDAVVECADKSKIKQVNCLVDRANKARATGGRPPNSGRIAMQVQNAFDADRLRNSHGKIVLACLRNKLQEVYSINSDLYQPTDYLRSESLESIAMQIWSSNE